MGAIIPVKEGCDVRGELSNNGFKNKEKPVIVAPHREPNHFII